MYIYEELPVMTAEEIRERSDNMLMNGVGFAIANAGLDKTNELAKMIGVDTARSNVLEAVQNILQTFHTMNVEMDLTTDGQFTCRLTFELDVNGKVGRHTLQ